VHRCVYWIHIVFGAVLVLVADIAEKLSSFEVSEDVQHTDQEPSTRVDYYLLLFIIYYSWNGGRAEAVCAGGKGVRMR
jgi:hypothetical protein